MALPARLRVPRVFGVSGPPSTDDESVDAVEVTTRRSLSLD